MCLLELWLWPSFIESRLSHIPNLGMSRFACLGLFFMKLDKQFSTQLTTFWQVMVCDIVLWKLNVHLELHGQYWFICYVQCRNMSICLMDIISCCIFWRSTCLFGIFFLVPFHQVVGIIRWIYAIALSRVL